MIFRPLDCALCTPHRLFYHGYLEPSVRENKAHRKERREEENKKERMADRCMNLVADVCTAVWSRSTAESLFSGLLAAFAFTGGSDTADVIGKTPAWFLRFGLAVAIGMLGHFVRQPQVKSGRPAATTITPALPADDDEDAHPTQVA